MLDLNIRSIWASRSQDETNPLLHVYFNCGCWSEFYRWTRQRRVLAGEPIAPRAGLSCERSRHRSRLPRAHPRLGAARRVLAGGVMLELNLLSVWLDNILLSWTMRFKCGCLYLAPFPWASGGVRQAFPCSRHRGAWVA